MNFTWFASAYDTDDVPYRLLTFVQIAGVLVLAAGVPPCVRGARLRVDHGRLRDHAHRRWWRSGCGPRSSDPERRPGGAALRRRRHVDPGRLAGAAGPAARARLARPARSWRARAARARAGPSVRRVDTRGTPATSPSATACSRSSCSASASSPRRPPSRMRSTEAGFSVDLAIACVRRAAARVRDVVGVLQARRGASTTRSSGAWPSPGAMATTSCSVRSPPSAPGCGGRRSDPRGARGRRA